MIVAMKPHIVYAHRYWKEFVQPGDRVVDATVGNGHDTFFLAQLLQGEGVLTGYDIQTQAIEQTKKRLGGLPAEFMQIVHLKLQSHADLEESGVKLIVYNLGYLPGGDKGLTTLYETTLQSIQRALLALTSDGALCITCYPGHAAGAKEEEVIIDFLKTLSASQWHICHHVWINRPLAPSLIWLQSVPGA